jgi:hypothetical protein
MYKKNKAIAGYHLLMILSVVDNEFTLAEDSVVAAYIKENFPLAIFSFDNEVAELSALNPDDYYIHFEKMMQDFYEDSTEKERMELINFAITLTKATMPITKEENLYLNELYNAWTETAE